jgi:hypothetical protein
MRSTAAQLATVGVGLWRGLGRRQPAVNARRISLRSAQCDRAAMHRAHRLASVSCGLRKANGNGLPTSVSVRSPPYEARASPTSRSRDSGCYLRVDQVLRGHRPMNNAAPCHAHASERIARDRAAGVQVYHDREVRASTAISSKASRQRRRWWQTCVGPSCARAPQPFRYLAAGDPLTSALIIRNDAVGGGDSRGGGPPAQ